MKTLWWLMLVCIGLVVYGRERGGPIEVVVGLIGMFFVCWALMLGAWSHLP